MVIQGDSALITFKSRAIAERVKRLKSGKELHGKTLLIRWKEGYTFVAPPKPSTDSESLTTPGEK